MTIPPPPPPDDEPFFGDPLADGPEPGFPPHPPFPGTDNGVKPVPPPPPPAKKKTHRVRNFFLVILLIVVVAALIWTWASVTFSYASAEQRGYVQTLSRSGWLCKTWEGELIVTSQTPGFTGPSVMRFTVRDDSVATMLQQAVGQPVVLQYEQHRGVPSSCFGETQTYVTGFRTLP